MKVTRLHQVALHSSDFARTRAFYEDTLGARHIATYDPPGLLFFDLSGVRLLFEDGAPRGLLYLWVDDIDAAYAELVAAGVAFENEPHLIFPDSKGEFGAAGEEEWMAFFRDPDDNQLALATRR